MIFSVPDPKNLDEARIAGLELDHAGWNELFLLEQAGLNRPHVVEFLKVKRINPLAEVELVAPEIEGIPIEPGATEVVEPEVQEVEEVPIEPEVAEVVEPEVQEVEEVPAGPEVEVPDPSTLTVDEIGALELTPQQWTRLLESEQAQKKPRKGVIDIALSRSGI